MKLITLFALLSIIVFTFAGCGKKGNCDECGQVDTLSKYVVQGKCGNAGMKGDVVYVCDDCKREYKMIDW